LAKDAVYLVRPDGYVAYASRDQDPKGIERLFSRFKLRPGVAAPTLQTGDARAVI
jgi:hypothetical protein